MADATVTVGDTVTVDYSVLNRGDISDTQDIILKVGGTEKDRDSGQTLAENETVRGTLIWDTSGESTGTYTLEVISDDDTESATVEVDDVASLPSSAIHRWKLDDVESGTATDSVGSADGAVTGVSNESGTYQGGSAGDGDGSDDNIKTSTLGNFGSTLDGNFAVAFTVDNFDTGTSTFQNLCAVSATGNSGNVRFQVYASLNNKGDVFMRLIDSNSDQYRVGTDSGHIDGNVKARVLINKTGNTGDSGIDFYVVTENDSGYSKVASSATFDENPTSYEDFTNDFAIFADNVGGTITRNVDAVLDDVIIYDSDLSSGERSDDYEIQPWS